MEKSIEGTCNFVEFMETHLKPLDGKGLEKVQRQDLQEGFYWLSNSNVFDGYGFDTQPVLVKTSFTAKWVCALMSSATYHKLDGITGDFYGPINLDKSLDKDLCSNLFISTFNFAAKNKLSSIISFCGEDSKTRNAFIEGIENLAKYCGNDRVCVLFADPAPNSLYFEIRESLHGEGGRISNGGLIFHEYAGEWRIHT